MQFAVAAAVVAVCYTQQHQPTNKTNKQANIAVLNFSVRYKTNMLLMLPMMVLLLLVDVTVADVDVTAVVAVAGGGAVAVAATCCPPKTLPLSFLLLVVVVSVFWCYPQFKVRPTNHNQEGITGVVCHCCCCWLLIISLLIVCSAVD